MLFYQPGIEGHSNLIVEPDSYGNRLFMYVQARADFVLFGEILLLEPLLFFC